MDGVLADFVGHACETVGGYFPGDFTSWKLEDTLDPLSAEQLRKATCEKKWCYRIPEYNGAGFFMNDLMSLGDVRILTAAVGDSDHWIAERKLYLNHHFGIDQEDIVFCPGKEKRFHFGDFLIEDRLDTCKDFANQWGHFGSKALLIDRPWNQGPTPLGVYRCSSYAEILELIKS